MTAFQHTAEPLLPREAFKVAVFRRSAGLCCICKAPAVDAHHILDRKLFVDGGYYISNGAAVCQLHHWQCETTALSVPTVRVAARINQVVLPDSLEGYGFNAALDKWGNMLLDGPWSGYRLRGPLGSDTGMNKALAAAGLTKWLLREMPTGWTAHGENHELD